MQESKNGRWTKSVQKQMNVDNLKALDKCYGAVYPSMSFYPPVNDWLAREYFYPNAAKFKHSPVYTLPQMLEKWLSDNKVYIFRRFNIWTDRETHKPTIEDCGYLIYNWNNKQFHQLDNLAVLASSAYEDIYNWRHITESISIYESLNWSSYFKEMRKFDILLELVVPHDNSQIIDD